MIKRTLLFLVIIFIFGVVPVKADVGVGVGIGKVVIDEILKPGIIYDLPNLPVINTGSDEGEYEVVISFNENQTELKPESKWFRFSPQKFKLKPGEIRQVSVMVSLPFKMEPGGYFAYLEAHPVISGSSGGAKMGIAAAAKLYFKVTPANYFQGLYYRIVSFGKVYYPWPQRGLWLLGLIVILVVFKHFFNIQIGIKKSQSKEQSNE